MENARTQCTAWRRKPLNWARVVCCVSRVSCAHVAVGCACPLSVSRHRQGGGLVWQGGAPIRSAVRADTGPLYGSHRCEETPCMSFVQSKVQAKDAHIADAQCLLSSHITHFDLSFFQAPTARASAPRPTTLPPSLARSCHNFAALRGDFTVTSHQLHANFTPTSHELHATSHARQNFGRSR